MKCIVLSGATVPFTSLIKAVDRDLVQLLADRGFTALEVQYGHAGAAFDAGLPNTHGFDFSPQIASLVHSCDLVITHAGSGSILDAVERGYGPAHRKVLVVVNTDLMDNHQLELARKLEAEGCVALCRSPSELHDGVAHALNRNFMKLAPAQSLQSTINQVLI